MELLGEGISCESRQGISDYMKGNMDIFYHTKTKNLCEPKGNERLGK